MPRTISIGAQDFAYLRENDCFYVDKTDFIREWWESLDSVTLITRPRRFGKTLNMSMLECFFSDQYAGRGDLFQGLSIWKEDSYRRMQGTYPVISLSFAQMKETNYEKCVCGICRILSKAYRQHYYLEESECLTGQQRRQFQLMEEALLEGKDTPHVHDALNLLSELLYAHSGKKPVILLDEYDTPMQEAYVHGFWEQLVSFTRNLFNASFKTNSSLGRAMMTGITRVSKESVFSDINNIEVVTATSQKYETAFGFTQAEVFAAMAEAGIDVEQQGEAVCRWYDGFCFGHAKNIYNPWSIINYLEKKRFATYWANTSSNSLISLLLQQADQAVKEKFGYLMQGESLVAEIDEEIVFDQLGRRKDAIWSLMLASGYLKIEDIAYPETRRGQKRTLYTLSMTNFEVEVMFEDLIRQWFDGADVAYNNFIKALLGNDADEMNRYMNYVAMTTFSYFDTGQRATGAEPERFYHGFVLGLMVELSDRYEIRSNRESGFGRYDVMLVPKCQGDNAYVLEFKVLSSYEGEACLEDTVANALRQIDERQYDMELIARGIERERIYHYGFAFEGKRVLIKGD